MKPPVPTCRSTGTLPTPKRWDSRSSRRSSRRCAARPPSTWTRDAPSYLAFCHFSRQCSAARSARFEAIETNQPVLPVESGRVVLSIEHHIICCHGVHTRNVESFPVCEFLSRTRVPRRGWTATWTHLASQRYFLHKIANLATTRPATY